MKVSLRRGLILAFAFMGGLAGESLLLVRTQITRFESLLRDDFRVIFFLKNDPSEGQVRIIEDKLMGLPDTAQATFMSRETALAALRREDPDLVDSVTWVGENPLPASFEVRPSQSGLGRFDEWLAAARTVSDWSETRYRPAQLRAILQARLYGHFLDLMLSALLCAVALALTAVIWFAGVPVNVKETCQTAALAAGGSAAGLATALIAASAARAYLPWWAYPSLPGQVMLWVGAAVIAALPFPWCED